MFEADDNSGTPLTADYAQDEPHDTVVDVARRGSTELIGSWTSPIWYTPAH